MLERAAAAPSGRVPPGSGARGARRGAASSSRPHRGLAEDRADVEHAQAAHLEEVPQHRRAAAFERLGGDARDSTTSSATRPWPRLMSSSASSLLPTPESPVISTPIPSTSRNTPWRSVDLGERLAQVARELLDHARRRQRRGEKRRVRARRAPSTSACGGATPSATITAAGVRLEQALDEAGDDADLVGAEDLDPVRMGEVQVPDQRRRPPQPRAAPPCRRRARDPRERQRLAVVVKQPRDAELRHPAAIR